ncbi:MAG: imidazolonepropionase [Anaerolineae bacterium]
MAIEVDLIVYGASQLLTLAGDGPRRGKTMSELGLIADGAIAIAHGRIVAIGTTSEVRSSYSALLELDAAGRVVLPGFVDAHTHLVFAGSRHDEFERRIAGATYLEIMAAGGGIMNTVRATRSASVTQLMEEAQPRLARMLAHGTTTAEVKTGYGLTTADEIKCLEVIHRLNSSQPVELVPTFLGAHALPEEYKGRAEAYVDLVVNEMLPAVWAQHPSMTGDRSPHAALFCDVFCDEGAFDLQQTKRILSAAKALGMPLKVHADEFAHLGAARLAAELGAISADHLLRTPTEELAALAEAGVIAVLLPGTPFGLGQHEYADARAMIAAGLPVALGTDLNPGTCYCESMPFIMALACRFMKMTPAEAIVASTVNAAYAIGHGSNLGRLQPGFVADLLVLEVEDYRHLAYRFGTNLVQKVIKRGNIVFTAAHE